ncbi:MAG: alpha/beta hydrolase [Cellvibrionaceae bacterium]
MGNKSIYKSVAREKAVATKYGELLRHWPIEKEERELQTRHGRTHVIVCGNPENPPLVLLHGAYGNAVYWIKQVQTYVQSHQVFIVDIIGEAGHSEPVRPSHKGPAYREWMEDIYQGLGLERAALVGVSLGAWICLTFACAWPERVDRLALISPQGIVRARRSRSAVVSFVSLLIGPLGRRLIFRSQLNKSDMDPKLKELIRLIQRGLKPRSGALPRFTEKELAQLYCPILLLLGGNDAYFNIERLILRMAKATPQLEINYRHKEGHFLSDFTREVDRFLVTHYAPD